MYSSVRYLILENTLQKAIIQGGGECKNLYGCLIYHSKNLKAIYRVVLRIELDNLSEETRRS